MRIATAVDGGMDQVAYEEPGSLFGLRAAGFRSVGEITFGGTLTNRERVTW